MKKKLLIIPSLLFLLILVTFFYLLIIERNPSEIPSNLLNKNVPNFEVESLLKKERFISSKHTRQNRSGLSIAQIIASINWVETYAPFSGFQKPWRSCFITW